MKPEERHVEHAKGLLWGIVCAGMWGFFPVYWKFLAHRTSAEILAHRIIWAFVFYLVLFVAFSRRSLPLLLRQSKRDWLLSIAASLLLSLNWGVYIYAVNSGRILEGSLAYFITPIMNVAIGVIFFGEAFPLVLKLSVAFASLGVAMKIILTPSFPVIALILAISFSLYGVTKKVLTIPALTSSVLEGAVGVVPALIAVGYFHGHAPSTDLATWALFMGGGIVTGLPLFLYSYSAQRIPYSIMGILQFIAPSLQLLVAVLVFHEEFGFRNAIAFGLIWIGVLFYLTFQLYRLRGGVSWLQQRP